MNLKIFQIGDKGIHLQNETWWNTPDLSGRGDSKNLVFTNKYVFQNTRFLTSTKNITISGSIYSTNNWGASEFVSYLETFIGSPMPVIAYYYNTSVLKDKLYDYDYDDKITWFENYAVIKNVNRNQINPFSFDEVSFAIELMGDWKVLDRFIWEYDAGLTNIYRTRPFDADVSFNFPTISEIEDKGFCKTFTRVLYDNNDFFYNENYWAQRALPYYIYSEKELSLPNLKREFFFAHELTAPPLTIYKFTNLSSTTAINISNTFLGGFHGEISQTDIIIPGGTLDYDELFVGDLTYNDNGDLYYYNFIRRGSDIIEQPEISYNYTFPAMLFPGKNAVTVTFDGDPIISYIHIGRRQ